MYTTNQICGMIDSLAHNIFMKFRGYLFCQVIEIPMERIVFHCSLTCFFLLHER